MWSGDRIVVSVLAITSSLADHLFWKDLEYFFAHVIRRRRCCRCWQSLYHSPLINWSNLWLLLINQLLHHFERVMIHQPNTWLSSEWKSEMVNDQIWQHSLVLVDDNWLFREGGGASWFLKRLVLDNSLSLTMIFKRKIMDWSKCWCKWWKLSLQREKNIL